MQYIVKNLPVGIYKVYAKDNVHTVHEGVEIDFYAIDGPGFESTWGIMTGARMFTVNFRDFDDNKTIYFTQYVQYSRSASYIGDVPTKAGYKFDEWRASDGRYGNLNHKWYINDTSAKNIYATWIASPTYTAKLNITLNGEEVSEGGDEAAQMLGDFRLQDAADSSRFISLNREKGLSYTAENVPNGTYYIFRNNEKINDAGAVIKVNDAGGEATLPFYSVHFMDGDSELAVRYEQEGAKMPEPVTPPVKEGYVFEKWVTEKDGDTEFDFEQNVTEQTFIYAKYIETETHTHNWSNTYGHDGDSHWHECLTPDCPITKNSEKGGFGEHTYGEWTVTKQPTTTEFGEEERICTVCGYKETKAVGKLPEDVHTHSYNGREEIIKDASCTEEGVKRIYCSVPDCGAYTDEKIEKTAHEFDTVKWKYDSDSHWHECVNCGTADERRDHLMSGEPVITPPDGNTPGLKTWDCVDCGYVKTEIIPVTPPVENPTVPNEPENPAVPSEPENPAVPDEPQNPPMTGDTARIQIYATLAMVSGMLYLTLYFADSGVGMTEEEKNMLVARLIGWAKGRGIIARYAALSAIFMILLVYHSIGRRVEVNLSEVRGK